MRIWIMDFKGFLTVEQRLGFIRTIVMFLSLSTAYTYNLSQAAEPPPIPELDTWKADMLAFGDLQCQYFMRGSYTGALGQNLSGYGDPYYDAARVFAQMRDYTGDAKWDQCSNSAAVSYRETQIDPNSGAAPFNNFSPGLRMHHQRTGDTKSKAAVHKLATAMFAADSTNQGGTNPPGYGRSFDLAREIAYAVLNHVDDEKLGQPRRARLAELIDYIRNHHNEWFTGYAISHPVVCGDFPGCMNGLQPFMVGLSMQALIYYHELTGDQTILPMMRRACDWLWTSAWRPNAGGFYYDSALGTGDSSAEPGLNLLIAPGYAWMYKMTGETKYRDQGDTIFGEGVRRTHQISVLGQEATKGAYLWNGKQFNQQYMWSFEYLKWRGGASDKNLSPSPPRTLRIS